MNRVPIFDSFSAKQEPGTRVRLNFFVVIICPDLPYSLHFLRVQAFILAHINENLTAIFTKLTIFVVGYPIICLL